MISVFGGFVLGDDPVLKMLGLGLATAIFVDVTAVRLVLVPASMKLMGEANWWLPAWLDRRLPVIDIDGGTGPGETAPSSPTCTTPSPHAEVVTSRM
jgi:RND superfamily putative drug exporter